MDGLNIIDGAGTIAAGRLRKSVPWNQDVRMFQIVVHQASIPHLCIAEIVVLKIGLDETGMASGLLDPSSGD